MLFSHRIVICYLFFVICYFPDAYCQSTSSYLIVKEIHIDGNKKTKEGIILRELNFKTGDTIPTKIFQSILERSRENILNTLLFNFVDTSTQIIDSIYVVVNINVKERWYFWPSPIFNLASRNFNEWWTNKDFSRTYYGMQFIQNNFRGRNETLILTAQLGYTQQLGLSYSIPYISKKKIGGLAWSVTYSQNHEIIYTTDKNKNQYYKDVNKYVREEIHSAVRYSNRQGLYNRHFFLVEYGNTTIADTVAVLNPDYFLKGRTHQQFIGINYLFKRDCRDIIAYPLRGYYYDFEILSRGMGILNNDVNILFITSTYKKFWQLHNRFYFASSLKGKLSLTQTYPYTNDIGLGYNHEYVRGYEYYVIDGQNYFLFKSNLKYQLVAPHVVKVNYIPLEKFNTIPYSWYCNLIFDMAYVQDKQYYKNNPLTNSLLLGTGIGIDYVTYYSMVFRLEYSINKLGERDIFLHLTIPI